MAKNPKPTSTRTEQAAQQVITNAEVAKHVLDQAAVTAAKAVTSDEKITQSLSEALRDVFGEHQASGRFIDVTRIPLLCKSVIDTNERIKEINDKLDNRYVSVESFDPVKQLVYGLVSLILVGVVGAIIALVLK